mgnify:CR=1 FL=1
MPRTPPYSTGISRNPTWIDANPRGIDRQTAAAGSRDPNPAAWKGSVRAVSRGWAASPMLTTSPDRTSPSGITAYPSSR